MKGVRNFEAQTESESSDRRKYRNSRVFYCIEAALEYFIAIMVGETYLAKIASELGVSDAVTGVLYAFVSLGSAFQIFAIFLANKTPVKRWITSLHIINQLAFTLVYAIPLFDLSNKIKIAFFIVFLLMGQILTNIANPAKINWFMSLVDDSQRGRFTAKKEILSLMGGMIFSFVMGNVIDYYEAKGSIRTAFLIGVITVFCLMVLHTLMLLLSVEKPTEHKTKHIGAELKNLLRNKPLLRVIGVSTIWYITNYMTTPFYGSYRINELGFTMTFCSVLAMIYSIVRSCFSAPMGRLADKRGFSNMLSICFLIQGVAFLINVFTVPSNGTIFYTAFYILNAVAMAGINSAQINLVYDYVRVDMRTGAFALSHAISGVSGFLITLMISPLVTYIQKQGNVFLGIPMYAQQLLSFFGVIMMVVAMLYIKFILTNKKKEICHEQRVFKSIQSSPRGGH